MDQYRFTARGEPEQITISVLVMLVPTPSPTHPFPLYATVNVALVLSEDKATLAVTCAPNAFVFDAAAALGEGDDAATLGEGDDAAEALGEGDDAAEALGEGDDAAEALGEGDVGLAVLKSTLLLSTLVPSFVAQ